MSDKSRPPAKKNRDTKRSGRPYAANEPGAQGGRAWVRPFKGTTEGEPSPREDEAGDAQVSFSDDARLSSRPPAMKPPDVPFRMQLGAAADDEARAHQSEEAHRRVQRLRPWVSALFLVSSLSLLVYLASLVMTLAGAAEAALVIALAALLSGGLLGWALGVACALRLHEWRWLAVIGLLPVVVVLMVLLLPLPPVAAYPLLPIVDIAYAWGKRGELFT